MKRILLSLFFSWIYFKDIDGWGPVGHSTVVRLAQSQLTNATTDWIRDLLPRDSNGNLSAFGSWADSILYPDTNPNGFQNWQWSRVLHYLNVPDWNCEYQPARDCVNDMCIAGAIQNYTKRLETESDETQLQEALFFLIHFVGDIHQPMHSGFRGDRGGNGIKGQYMNGSTQTNLHAMWDEDMINTRLNRDFHGDSSLYYNHIHQLMRNQSIPSNDDEISQWIKENFRYLCPEMYLDESNSTMNASTNFILGEIYYQRNLVIIEQRLAHAGRRLGRLLDTIKKTRLSSSSTTGKDQLYFGTIALIIILSIELI